MDAARSDKVLIELKDESIGYRGRGVLTKINVTIRTGERIALLGRSGAGKSTLLNWLYDRLSAQAALIPQATALVPQLSIFHNVYMGRLDRYSSLRNLRELISPSRERVREVEALLDRFGMADAIRQKAGSLSGGQAQRVSVARALYNGRPIVLGDEPVSALDRAQGARVLEAICAAHSTSVLVLHDVQLALRHASRVITLMDGRIALDQASQVITEADIEPFYATPR